MPKVKNRATGKVSELNDQQYHIVMSDPSWHRVFEVVEDSVPDEVIALQEKQGKEKIAGKSQTGAKDNNTKPTPAPNPEEIPQ